ncbi:MAG: DUF3857 domain-containing protein [Raineya sp.]|jgi:predicted Zn-dependent protease|nr:DUF3857 domain-containing protein [Raineya sp.]
MIFSLKKILTTWMLHICCLVVFADPYQDAWQAIRENNLPAAKELLIRAMQNPQTRVDACMTLILIENNESDMGNSFKYFYDLYQSGIDLNPYLYAKWFDPSVLGEYGKKNANNLKLLNNLLKDPKTHPSIITSLQYMLGIHWMYSNKLDKSLEEWKKIYSVNQWQFVGPFDNVSGSGFDKPYLPISSPESSKEFISSNGAKIYWFTPKYSDNDGWVTTSHYIPQSTAVVYAQSFVYVPEDTDAIVNAGAVGSLKVWVNDALFITEEEERKTELDIYKAPCKLKKGYNRILVQLGYVGQEYSNFIVRLTDRQLQPIQGITYSNQLQPYTSNKSEEKIAQIPHFAEEFFKKKIEEQPENPINYLLLSQAYRRTKKITEARSVMQKIFQKDPNNLLIRTEYLLILSETRNRTEFLKELNDYKEKYPDSYLTMFLNFEQLLEEEKNVEAEEKLDKIIDKYGEREELAERKMKLLALLKKEREFVSLVYTYYKKYPDNSLFNYYYFLIQQQVNKDRRENIKIYENFLKNNYHYRMIMDLVALYLQQSMPQKAIKMLEKMEKHMPQQPEFTERLGDYYYGIKDYPKALEYINKSIAQSPYSSRNWLDYALIKQMQNQKNEALDAYKKALYFNPNDYKTREKIRNLENKTDLGTVFPKEDYYAIVKNGTVKPEYKDYDWYYIFDEKNKIIYPEGGSQTYTTLIVRVLNQKGVDYWHQTNLGYNEYSERIVVEKAELIKKNNSKINAETNDGQVVFPNLEIGDVILIKYKTETYFRGRFAKDFWDTYSFSSSVPSEQTRYSLLIPKEKKFEYKVFNSDLKPQIKEVDEFNLYVWEDKDVKAVKSEKYGQLMQNSEKVLQISTLNSWQDLALWYADISAYQAKPDFEVEQAFTTIFPNGVEKLTKLDRAKLIYEYISKNIQYSSLPFRQSAYVPQKASKTLSTKLGDCKDVSTLFAALARKADIPVNLQLVTTRDNTESALPLPALMFNHCIVKASIDGKTYYLELTDPYLPFGALPWSVDRSSILNIPFPATSDNQTENKLETLVTTPNKNIIHRIRTVKIENNNLTCDVKSLKTGSIGARMRSDFINENEEKRKEEITKSISSDYKNPVSLIGLEFENIEKITDTLKYSYKYVVKNEIAEIGALKVLKVPYSARHGRIDIFTEETRKSPIDYSYYEDVDTYIEDITIQVPQGTSLVDIPKDVTINADFMKFELKFTKINPQTLRVYRKMTSDRFVIISTKDYTKFKNILTEINNVENKYITYK